MSIQNLSGPDDKGTLPEQQVQGQQQLQQQQVIVNVHTGEKAAKGSGKKVRVPVGQKPAQPTNTNEIGSRNNFYGEGGMNVVNTGQEGIAAGKTEDSNIGRENTIGEKKAENPPEPPTPPEPPVPPEPDKPTIPKPDRQLGESLAEQLYAETSSSFANNGNIANVFGKVSDKTAYTFFKHYAKLADEDVLPKTKAAMHDTYDVWDTFNNINVKITNPAVQALLDQAEGIGLGESDEYSRLNTQLSMAKNKTGGLAAQIRTPDLNGKEADRMDGAIKELVEKMSQEYQ